MQLKCFLTQIFESFLIDEPFPVGWLGVQERPPVVRNLGERGAVSWVPLLLGQTLLNTQTQCQTKA